MQLLTLNTHSWMEADDELQLDSLAKFVASGDFDAICLQEVNQPLVGNDIEDQKFCEISNQIKPNAKNFAYLLVRRLKELGFDYFWSWQATHIGYDKFYEGVAILSKTKLNSAQYLISKVDDLEDFHTRKLLVSHTKICGSEICLASCHMSWYTDETSGFAYELNKLEDALINDKGNIILMGDFNAPDQADDPSYQMLCGNNLGLMDSYINAEKSRGCFTALSSIDGWNTDKKEPMRIDYVWLDPTFSVELHEVCLDGENGPIVSDHAGIRVLIN